MPKTHAVAVLSTLIMIVGMTIPQRALADDYTTTVVIQCISGTCTRTITRYRTYQILGRWVTEIVSVTTETYPDKRQEQ